MRLLFPQYVLSSEFLKRMKEREKNKRKKFFFLLIKKDGDGGFYRVKN